MIKYEEFYQSGLIGIKINIIGRELRNTSIPKDKISWKILFEIRDRINIILEDKKFKEYYIANELSNIKITFKKLSTDNCIGNIIITGYGDTDTDIISETIEIK